MLHAPYQGASEQNINLTAEFLRYRKAGGCLIGTHLPHCRYSLSSREADFGWLTIVQGQAEQSISTVPTLHARCISWIQPANLFPQLPLILFIRAGAAQQMSPLQLLRDNRWRWLHSYYTASGLWSVEFHISHSAFRWRLIMREDFCQLTTTLPTNPFYSVFIFL